MRATKPSAKEEQARVNRLFYQAWLKRRQRARAYLRQVIKVEKEEQKKFQ